MTDSAYGARSHLTIEQDEALRIVSETTPTWTFADPVGLFVRVWHSGPFTYYLEEGNADDPEKLEGRLSLGEVFDEYWAVSSDPEYGRIGWRPVEEFPGYVRPDDAPPPDRMFGEDDVVDEEGDGDDRR